MKKNGLIALIVVVIVVVGAFAIFHKSSKSSTPASTTASQSKTSNANNAILVIKTDSTLGQYFTDPSGKPLYTYNADTSGVSNCTGSCLANWPAYQVSGSTSNLPPGVGTLKRSDNGQTQYTYNGMPLYYFANDSAGKPTGNGVDNFKLAAPSASTSSSTPSSSTTSQSSSSSSSGGYNY